MRAHLTMPPLPSDDKRWAVVSATMRRHGYSSHALIESLHTVQQLFGYLDLESLRFVAASLRVPLSRAYGVATFYHFFHLQPPAKHTCMVCTGTACYIKGGRQLMKCAEETMELKVGSSTTENNVSLLSVRCVGSCSFAPIVMFDQDLAGDVTRAQLQEHLETWIKAKP